MKPRITVVTLGVGDLHRALHFYRDGLGLPTKGIVGKEFEHGAVAFFDLQSGLRLVIWPRESIANDSGLPVSSLSPTAFMIGHDVSSEADVEGVMAQAGAAGATVVKAGHGSSSRRIEAPPRCTQTKRRGRYRIENRRRLPTLGHPPRGQFAGARDTVKRHRRQVTLTARSPA